MNFLQVPLALLLLCIPSFYLKSFAETIEGKSEIENIISGDINDEVSLQESYYLLGPGDNYAYQYKIIERNSTENTIS